MKFTFSSISVPFLTGLASVNASTPASPIYENTPVDITRQSLITVGSSMMFEKTPWLHEEANSEQRNPIYIGATPREMEIDQQKKPTPALPQFMKKRGEAQAEVVRKELKRSHIELEAWPVRDDIGQLTWFFSRWRADTNDSWHWLESKSFDSTFTKAFKETDTPPMLPVTYDLSKKKTFGNVFDDFLEMTDLYAKPVFGDCIWTSVDGNKLFGAWLPTAERQSQSDRFTANAAAQKNLVCKTVPEPSRFNEEVMGYTLPVSPGQVSWPGSSQLTWSELPSIDSSTAKNSTAIITNWPTDFQDEYKKDILTLSGKKFTRKNSAQKDNQLLDIVQYLSDRYQSLGLKTRRDEFVWRGIPQANLIAIIPGTLKGAANTPVLMADHFDTAFSENTYAKNKRRESVPGADDNLTATASLLRAAEILKDSKPEHDIWLLHLTGEEFPGDDLGARNFVGNLLKNRQDIAGLVLMDMIGWRNANDPVFQISAGTSSESLQIAQTAMQAAGGAAPDLQPVIRSRFDPKSYLYNTDGISFSDAGFPVILLNEHINYWENLERSGYHDTTDTVDRLDWDYATQIAKTAIETVARLAGSTR